MGLDIKSMAPNDNATCSFSGSLWEVTKITGIAAVSGHAFNCLQTSKPDSSGMLISRTTKSGSCAFITENAFALCETVTTFARDSTALSNNKSVVGSSSMMTTFCVSLSMRNTTLLNL